MLFRVDSASLLGIEAYPVEVEVDIALGFPGFVTVGLPDAAVRESKERVRAALKNCGFDLPPRKVTINLAPADRRKEGSAFDLPIALGFLADLGVVPEGSQSGRLFLGELAMDGRLKPVKGILSVALMARSRGYRGLIVPKSNEREAALVPKIEVFGLETLGRVVALLNGREAVPPCDLSFEELAEPPRYDADFRDVRGQHHVRRAMELAAAGGHNILMIGPPGAGKTMLARRLPGILPPMTFEETIEVTQVYSAAGLLPNAGALSVRPFRAPHHTVSHAGLVGGGSVPRPGEISLAHNGILFLDEMPEFRRGVLEDLRQPLEDGRVAICRSGASVVFPSAFMLVAAMNPCEDVFQDGGGGEADCTEAQRRKYYARISRPLLDRIDIQVEVPQVKYREIVSRHEPESSESIRERVCRTREVQLRRFAGKGIFANARMGTRDVRTFCAVDKEGEKLLEAAVTQMGFSARAYDRILKVARTIADLEGVENIGSAHISEAIQYRMMDRRG